MKKETPPRWLYLATALLLSAGMALFLCGYPSLFRIARKSHPGERVALYVDGGTNLQRKITVARHTAESLPYQPSSWAAWGHLLLLDGDIKAAKTALTKAIGIRSGPPPEYKDTLRPFYHPYARLGLMKLAFQEKNFAGVLHHFEMASAYEGFGDDPISTTYDEILSALEKMQVPERIRHFRKLPDPYRNPQLEADDMGVEPDVVKMLRGAIDEDIDLICQSIPSDHFLRPFVLARLWRHTSIPAYTDELQPWMTRVLPLQPTDTPPFFRNDDFVLEGVQQYRTIGDRMLVMLRWRHAPSKPEPRFKYIDGQYQVTWNDQTLSLQWVFNRVLPFEYGTADAYGTPAGWINPDREWGSTPDTSTWSLDVNQSGGHALRIETMTDSDALPRALSPPVTLSPGEVWIGLGTVRCETGSASIGWEFLGRDEQVWASGDVVTATTGARASGAAWTTPWRQWTHVRMVAGLPAGTGAASFEGVALFSVKMPTLP